MTIPTAPARKLPWLIIILGVLAVLCLCAVVIAVAILAFLTPIRGSTTVTEPTPIEIFDTAVPEILPTRQGADSPTVDAAPAGTAVDIGNEMTLTILDVTRPADDLVANGSVLNATAPAGEEFMRVDLEVTCNSDPETPCTFYPTVMKAVLGDGSTRDLQTFIEGVEDWDTSIEIEGGATRNGFLLFIVPKSEGSIVVSYTDIYADQPVYLQLP